MKLKSILESLLDVSDKCPQCHGLGTKTVWNECRACGGRGDVVEPSVYAAYGWPTGSQAELLPRVSCRSCGASGRIAAGVKPCDRCSGKKIIPETSINWRKGPLYRWCLIICGLLTAGIFFVNESEKKISFALFGLVVGLVTGVIINIILKLIMLGLLGATKISMAMTGNKEPWKKKKK